MIDFLNTSIVQDVNLCRIQPCDMGGDISKEKSYEQRDVAAAQARLNKADYKEQCAEANLERFKLINGVPLEGKIAF